MLKHDKTRICAKREAQEEKKGRTPQRKKSAHASARTRLKPVVENVQRAYRAERWQSVQDRDEVEADSA
jgi:hypothetical protein